MIRSPCLRILGSRLLQMVPVIVLATLVVFGLMHLVPGDPAVMLAGEHPTPERIEQIRRTLGLDLPFLQQYAHWVGNAATGDLSRSLMSSEPVLDALQRTLPHTLLIVAMSLTLSLLIGIPLGVAAATRSGSKADSAITGFSSLGIAVPNFWLAMLLIAIFSLQFGWFPASGATSLGEHPLKAFHQALLPALALAAGGVSEIARQVRSALAEVLGSQYVRTLRAKGLSPFQVVYRHGLKNVGVTVLTVAGLLINRLLGATVVIEAVFAIPGTGSLVVNAALAKDFPVIQGVVLAMVILVLITNIVIDILYTFIDPRTMHR
jgi:peptide/nickel transport system permease protein